MRENDEITGLFRSRSFSEVSPRSRSRLCCICTGSCFCRFLVFLSERGNQGGLYTSGGHDAGR